VTEPRTRLDAALADRYRLERELGAGGMATVYLAEDLKHDRKVAVKVLRPELAAVIGAERFLQEIKLTANLQHPHILPLHDSGEADSFLYYVMPYVEGESLRDKLNREKQFGVDEAVRLATQVAAALDYAHRQGVVHRDIKPENVLIHDGNAQVADFGIALAVSAAGSSRMTETGMSIGTPQYMSPEQAMGDRELDARSDIYSLAAMLYEMLTGDPPYTGSTAQAIVAKVITEKAPPVRLHRETVPAHVSAAISHALNKLPADRFASAADFADALVRPGAMGALADTNSEAPVAQVARRPWWHVAGALVLGGAATAVAMLFLLREPAVPGQVTRFEVAHDEIALRFSVSPALALSPDGSRLVFPGSEGLYLRDMDKLEIRLLPATENAVNVSFSPDGEWILYDQSNELKKVRLAGGGAITLARGIARGASWGPDGTIAYASPGGDLVQMTDAGANPRVITRPDTAQGEVEHRYPDVLPAGRGVLLTVWKQAAQDAHIAVYDANAGMVKDLGPGISARYVESGFIMYGDPVGGALLAAPFDLERLEMGSPVPVLEGVSMTTAVGGLHATVSRSGALAYLTGAQRGSNLLRVDRRGTAVSLTEEKRGFWEPRFSPDGRRIAVRVGGENDDIWIYDLEGKTQTRLTVEGSNQDPAWTPDGQRVTFSSERNGVRGIFTRPWDGSAAAESLVTVTFPQVHAGGWAPDGSLFVYRVVVDAGNRDLYTVASTGGSPTPFLSTDFDETAPQISPNGRWLAYQSNESGRFEVYVRPFPGGGGRIPISTNGGVEAVWGPDGKELFYINNDGDLISVQVESAGAFRVGERVPMFSVSDYNRRIVDVNYDISPDGQSFVMMRAEGSARGLILVQNWIEEVRQAVGPSGR